MRLTHPAAGLAAAAMLGLAACGSEGNEEAAADGPSLRTITIAETEFKLEPSTVTIGDPGVYTFRAVNHGAAEHALEVEGEGTEAKTDTIAAGGSAEVKVELKKGTYELYCPIDGHKDKGMEGSISVGGAAGGDGTTTGDDGQDDGGYSY